MANNYTDGTGALVYNGDPRLSPVSQLLMKHVHQYHDGSGFYLEEGAYVSPEDVAADLIDHAITLLDSNDAPEYSDLRRQLAHIKDRQLDYGHETAQRFPELLRQAGVAVNDMLDRALRDQATHPLDYVIAVIEDPQSNLRSTRYQEAFTCDKQRLDEFGGAGVYWSRHVDFAQSSYGAVQFAEKLDAAIASQDEGAVTDVIAWRINEVLNAIRDSECRERVARELLKGTVLDLVEDGIVNRDGED